MSAMRRLLTLLTFFMWILPLAHAERSLKVVSTDGRGQRVALVIGNGSYKDSPLVNPANDAEDMANTLRGLGFEVIALKNANQREMKKSVREFGQKLRGAEAGMFFFAGHGLQVKGINYLVPVSTEIDSEADAEDQAVSLDYVMRTMEDGGARFNIAILDACRNNPFARSFRSNSRGLAQTQAATGTLIAYATSPGSVASDGSGRNGIYTKHLIKNIEETSGDILRVFQNVRTSVVEETGGKQTPWESISLVGDFYFKSTSSTVSDAPQIQNYSIVPDAVEYAEWALIESNPTKEGLEGYLNGIRTNKYKGLFVKQAALLLKATGKSKANSVNAPLTASNLTGNIAPESIATQTYKQDGLPTRKSKFSYSVKDVKWGRRNREYTVNITTNPDEILANYVLGNDVLLTAPISSTKRPLVFFGDVDSLAHFDTTENYAETLHVPPGKILRNIEYVGPHLIDGIANRLTFQVSAHDTNEEVTVPAGRFNTLKISFKGENNYVPYGLKRVEIDQWHSKSLRRWVKQIIKLYNARDSLEDEIHYELVSTSF